MLTERYYVVREDLLPEAIIKTIAVKEMLARGEAATIHEAVEKADLSRSAFYKYREGVLTLGELERGSIITVSIDLEHRAGILSQVLSMFAARGGNVLTIHQSIPLQGSANVMLSVDTAPMKDEVFAFVDELRLVPGVKRASVIGQG
ncbi:ACT domain-containing protein [Paenibacillus sp. D51F]